MGLLLLREIIGSLPIVKNSSAISESFLGDSLLNPLVIANAIIDTIILLVILTFGLSLGRTIQIHGQRFSGLGKIVTQATLVIVLILAYKTYELPAACFFVGRTEIVHLASNAIAAPGSYGDFVGAWGPVMNSINAAAIQNASGDAMNTYQQIALSIFLRPPDYYAWTFLILIAIPIIGLVPLLYRNLGTIADLFSHGGALLLQGIPAPVTSPNRVSSSPAAAITTPNPVYSSPAAATVPPPATAQSATLRVMADKIAKMKTLVDSGAISKDDFGTQKQRILGLAVDASAAVHGADDFLKLKSLLETGALTEEEYEAQKQRFLQHI